MKTYIYAHINPETGEVVYIGRGVRERAWGIQTKRSDPHRKFLSNLENMGFVPSDWVVVLCRSLPQDSATKEELRLIRELLPMFNQQGAGGANAGRGEENHNAKLTEDSIRLMREEYSAGGISIRGIGRKYGVAYTTARGIIYGTKWSHIN